MRVVVLGGGPGGYVCAIRAAQLGAEVTLIEQQYLGGTCLNSGCIPTKVLLHTTEIYDMLRKQSSDLGLKMNDLALEWGAVQHRKDMIVSQLTDGIKTILETNQINVIVGKGRFITNNELEVITRDKQRIIAGFDKAVIATGSEAIRVPIPGADLEGVLTSTEALSLENVPESICIIGGGVIGCEFASIYSSAGSKVTIVEMLPNLIANMDEEIVECLKNQFLESGIDINTNAKVEKIEKHDTKLKVTVSTSSGIKNIVAEKILISTGRKPNISQIGLENLGVKIDKGSIAVDKSMKTNVDNIYAIGDCTGGVLLAHVASAEGIIAAENMMGKYTPIDFKTIPYCVYTKPEIASVGLNEKQALKQGYSIKVGKFPLYANGKSVIKGEVNGLVKFVIDEDTDEILGLHIAGPNATELIAVGAMAIRLEATLDEIISTIYAHPTVSESIHEAAHAVYENAIHMPRL